MSTRTPIASITLNAATSSVTFANIPQTYTDLVLVVSAKGTGFSGSGTYPYVRYNSDSNTNYSRTWLAGNGSTASSSRGTSENLQYLVGGTYIDGTFSYNSITQFMNYSNTTTYKTMLSRANNAGVQVDALAGLWRSTSAITSIVIYSSNGNFDTGSTFNLYGIDAELSAQAKAYGGDTIVTDGTYWYHTFYSSGTFTPTAALTADYLVVAGGGGGGKSNGGGGGGGGLRSTVTASGGSPGTVESALSLTAQAYTVTVGGGGAGGATNQGTNGSNSVFSTITSTGGGGGGSQVTPAAGLTGGSGGGGAYQSGAGGSGTANQGFAGGTGDATNGLGASGGGASAVGGNANYFASSPGGAGVATTISGSSVTYAGGGGAGGYSDSGTRQQPGGAGGGGKGGGSNNSTSPDAGSTNTGGGGGGGYASNNGAAGGSGIVIIRYSV